ncbi:SDR family oxidoreductase [Chitinophaga sp. MD30]|uniref:SDR family oxidoreductase n=1 Tax=Chitinophaga sp. MD30 TaxID=2033437 RepID=UPI000BAFE5C4|nr:SDR family oxidoreductase [Chitinophaga sp. MD30]ASZ12600.1 hypothetical protein CK934_17370 [Chitinophaga sp. MD30]
MKFVNRKKKFIKVSTVTTLKAGTNDTLSSLIATAKAAQLEVLEISASHTITAKENVNTGSQDIVICTGIITDLSSIKRVLKKEGLLCWQHPAASTDRYLQLQEEGFEIITDNDNTLIAKSDGRIAIRLEETTTAPAAPVDNMQQHTQQEDWLKARVISIAAATISLAEKDFDTTAQFSDYGFDSILGTELIRLLNEKLDISLKATDLYSYANIDLLTDYIRNNFTVAIPVQQTTAHIPTPLPDNYKKEDIAIIGMSAQFGRTNNAQEFWQILKTGQSLITRIPKEKWNTGIDAWSSCITDADKFDPLFFKLSGSEAEMMDPKQRLFLEHCWKAIEDAGINPESLSGSRCGVYAGVGPADYAARMEGTLPAALWGNSAAILASRIAYFLNLKGPAVAIDTACSSSLVAMEMACSSLQRGDTDLVITGGVNIINDAHAYMMADRAGMLSPDGRCYTFDSRANGFVMGEGIGVLMLKRLSDAVRDNDRIYGVVKGILTNQDGTTNGITAPSMLSQQELEKTVYNKFGINPETITYVEAHGTGTSLGDPIEFEALCTSFRTYTGKQQFCGLGSVKTNIGHTLEAAGAASVIKVLLSLQHRQLPPTINYKDSNPLITLQGSPFRIQTQLTDWEHPADQPRRAAISSFGFSGTNVHMVIEEYIPVAKPTFVASKPAIIPLSAKTTIQLQQQVDNLLHWLQDNPGKALADIAYTLQTGRAAMEKRAVFLADTITELTTLLQSYPDQNTGRSFNGTARKRNKTADDNTRCASMIATGTWQQLAEHWVNGGTIDWKLLYNNTWPDKISLPPYPFARESYWIAATGKQPLVTTVPQALHPLLHTNDSTFGQQSYTTMLSGEEFFLTDHLVKNEKIFPAVAYLEMARAAGEMATAGLITQLKDVSWLMPINVKQEAVKTTIQLQQTSQGIAYEIYTNDATRLHGQGYMTAIMPPAIARQDIASLLARCTAVKEGPACYEVFRSLGLQYGPAFQGLKKLCHTSDEALSNIVLPTNAGFVLSPGILDSVLQTCMGINLGSAALQMMLPFSAREINIYNVLPEEVWCYARRSNTGRQVSSYDITVMDAGGQVLLTITELILLPVEQSATMPAAQQLHLYTAQWQLQPIRQHTHTAAALLFLINAPALLVDKLQETLECEVIGWNAGTLEACYLELQSIIKNRWKNRLATHLQVICTHEDYTEYGCISAMIDSASQESHLISGSVITVENLSTAGIDTLSALLTSEYNSKDSLVRYENGDRFVKGLQPLHEANNGITIREGGVYLITGGAGGLGLIFTDYIRQYTGTKVVLTGRSTSPKQTLPAGTRYYACDVSDEPAVHALIAQIIAEYGRLDGIIHSAGVLRDSFLINKTAAEVAAVCSGKIAGARNLDIATKERSLDFMLYCSSLAGVFGNAGQSDYAMANAWLDNYAGYRESLRSQGKRQGRTLSINWPLWKEGGMQIDDATASYMEQHYGLSPMPVPDGLLALTRLLNSTAVQGTVIFGNNGKLPGLVITPVTPTPVVNTITTSDVSMAAATQFLANLMSGVLKIPANRLETEAPFEQFGIDSTIIIKLTNELEGVFGKIPRTLFFECQNLQELTAYFLSAHREQLQSLTGTTPRPVINQERQMPIPAVTKSPVRQPAGNMPIADVAIIGISGRYPGANNLAAFWDNLKAGKDSITEIPATRWNLHAYYDKEKGKTGKTYSKWGGFIDHADQFDPMFFNISAREAELMDPQERIFLQTVWETIEDAGYTRSMLQGDDKEGKVGVYVGVMYEEYQLFGPEETAKGNPIALLGNPSGIANRVSYFLNLHGPSMAVDTMCSSSLTAIHLACKDLQTGETELAIAGGVNLSLHPNKYLILSEGGFASSKGRCESFGEGGEGYVPGEGVGAVLLKPLARALADGDRIYGVIKGTAVNHGGKTNGYTVPNPKAQTAVIKAAMHKAGITPADISYIEAHGTGTSLGDPIEIAGLQKAFDTDSKQYCSIGSVKSNIGHCESAAGISGLTKVVLQLQHKQLVPSLHATVLNPNIDFSNTPFKVQQQLEDWRADNGKPRLAGISSFGAGGSNAHLIVAEYNPPAVKPYHDNTPAIIVLSAQNKERLRKMVINLKQHLQHNSDINLHDIAYTLQTGREEMEERLAFLATSAKEMVTALNRYLENDGQDLFTGNTRKDNPDFLLNGKAGQAYIQSALREREGSSLAQIWVKGVQIDWNLLYTAGRPARISLPAYPFAEERYWYPKAEVMPTVNIQLHPLLHALKHENSF